MQYDKKPKAHGIQEKVSLHSNFISFSTSTLVKKLLLQQIPVQTLLIKLCVRVFDMAWLL
jgi:hypothetical protein